MRYVLLATTLFLVGITLQLYGKIKVCTTTSLIADLVKNAGGDLVETVSLMGPGVDPHSYKAKDSDRKKLSSADIIFYNGLHLEGRMTDVFEDLAAQGKAVFAVSDGIDKKSLIALKGNAGYDPHVWFDPTLWAQCLDKVVEELKKKDLNNATQYENRGAEFKKQLEGLFGWGKEMISKRLHKDARILITSHDAYNYFGRAFEFQVIGVQGVSTVSEAGLADIASTVAFIKKHGVKAIFVESSVSPAAIEQISKASGTKIGGKLFSDSLGGKNEMFGDCDVGTYIGMFKYNMETIVNGLK